MIEKKRSKINKMKLNMTIKTLFCVAVLNRSNILLLYKKMYYVAILNE